MSGKTVDVIWVKCFAIADMQSQCENDAGVDLRRVCRLVSDKKLSKTCESHVQTSVLGLAAVAVSIEVIVALSSIEVILAFKFDKDARRVAGLKDDLLLGTHGDGDGGGFSVEVVLAALVFRI
jgi:hypothetical protein